jgi:MinD superfamily P-loop ATPase
MDSTTTAGVRAGSSARQRQGWVMVFAPKGGVGKTTTVINLAVCAARAGLDPLAVDLDVQGSLSQWAKERAEREDAWALPQVLVHQGSLDRRDEAYRLARGRGFVVFDSPPGLEGGTGEMLREVARRCDLVVVPCEMFPASISKLKAFGDVFRRIGVPHCFLITKAIAAPKLLAEAREELAPHGAVLDASVAIRADIARMMGSGVCPSDDPRLPGASEYARVWSLVSERVLP